MATAWRRVNRVRVPRNPYEQPGDCVLHMAQEIVLRYKHNMLSLLYATCLKLLVFFSARSKKRTNTHKGIEINSTLPSHADGSTVPFRKIVRIVYATDTTHLQSNTVMSTNMFCCSYRIITSKSRYMSWNFRGDRIQYNLKGQTAASVCEILQLFRVSLRPHLQGATDGLQSNQ